MSPRRVALAATLAAMLAAGNPLPAEAQQARVSPFLPAGHWAVETLRSLHGQGLLPRGYDPAFGRQTTAETLRGLRAAAPRSETATAALERLLEELGPGWTDGAPRRPVLATALAVGGEDVAGRMLAGHGGGFGLYWLGPLPAADVSGATGTVEHRGRVWRVAWGVDAGVGDGGATIRDAYVMGGVGPVGVWGGLVAGSFRNGPDGGVVLSRMRPGPGGGLLLLEPVALPGFLRHLGPVRFATQLYVGGSNGEFESPWLWFTRGSIEPHPRFQLGVNRGVMFGGDGNDDGGFRELVYLLIGKHSGGFDNQIVSVTGRYRIPTDPLIPLTGYFEWGFEDSAGAWRDVPGIVAGLESPALPFAPGVSLGASWTKFEGSCCGNPIWYRNWAFDGGWSDAGEPLGHPLGGHGHEWQGYGRLVALDARLQLELAGFTRWRGEENLFAPARTGESRGGRGELTLMPMAGWQLFAAAELERGDGDWSQRRLKAGIRASF